MTRHKRRRIARYAPREAFLDHDRPYFHAASDVEAVARPRLDDALDTLAGLFHRAPPPAPSQRPDRPVRADRAILDSNPLSRAWSSRAGHCGTDEARRRRGLDYLFAGAVLDLKLSRGQIAATVQGTRRYRVRVEVLVPSPNRIALVRECVDMARTGLLPGESLASAVQNALVAGGPELLPSPTEMRPFCSCPDGPRCKHVVAAVHAVAACLATEPELLLKLWSDEPEAFTAPSTLVIAPLAAADTRALAGDLSQIFDIDLPAASQPASLPATVDPPALPPSSSPEVKREYLRVLGLPARIIDAWLREGVLRRTGRHGVYARTDEANRRICEYLAQ